MHCVFSDEHRSRISNAIDQIVDQWLSPQAAPAFPGLDYDELAQRYQGSAIPRHGVGIEALAEELQRNLVRHTPKLNHPRYIGHMTQTLPPWSVALDGLTAALNQNQVKLETAYASTLMEKQTLSWLHRMVYQFDDAFYAERPLRASPAIGNMVSGATLGNFTALATALAHGLPGVREHGLVKALANSGHAGVAVMGSARLHYSLKKAVASLGLGTDSLYLIPVDQDNRIQMPAARHQAQALADANIKIIAIIGIAGATETGSIDPLDQLADLARDYVSWLHVDAAWGGALMMSAAHRHLFHGVERADSVVIDGHKLFFVTMAQGAVLFRSEHSLQLLRHHANYILRPSSGDLGQTSLEGSRRFDALKLWATLKCLGTEGYAQLFAHAGALCEHMKRLIGSDEAFELITSSDTFIMTYRYVPPAWRAQLDRHLADGHADAALALNQKINRLNEQLQAALKEDGASFVSRTVLESTAYPGETTVLRLVLTNIRTTPADLDAALALQRRIAQELPHSL